MIALKLVFQTLGTVAVGGTVVSGAAYKISSDNQIAEAKKTLEAKQEELIQEKKSLKELQKQNDEKIQAKKVLKTNAQTLVDQYKNTEIEINKEINSLTKDIEAKTSEISALTTVIEELLKDKNSKAEAAKSAKAEFENKTSTLAIDKKDAQTKATNLINATNTKNEAQNNKVAAENKKTEDEAKVKTLTTQLQQEKEKETTDIAAHTAEKEKPLCVTETEGTNSTDSSLAEGTHQDQTKLSELSEAETASKEKALATTALLDSATITAAASLKDFNLKNDLLTTSKTLFNTANKEDTAAKTKVTTTEDLLNKAKTNNENAISALKTSTDSHSTSSQKLSDLVKEKTQKEKDKAVKDNDLTKNALLIKNKELELTQFQSEIDLLEQEKKNLELELTKNKVTEEQFSKDLKKLS